MSRFDVLFGEEADPSLDIGSVEIDVDFKVLYMMFSNLLPLMDGEASIGTDLGFARGDHRHPSDETKVDKVEGKGLSTNDFTNEDKETLSGFSSHVEDTNIHTTSEDKKAITAHFSDKIIHVTQEDRQRWDEGVGGFSGDYNDLINKPRIPTSNNQLANGAGYQTANNVNMAIAAALANLDRLTRKRVAVLPAIGDSNVIYMVPAENSETEGDVFNEYMYIDDKYELIGSSNINLDGYATTDFVLSKVAEIDLTPLENEIATKQDALTFDTTPTSGSTNPVTSHGIRAALNAFSSTIVTRQEFDQTIGKINEALDAIDELVYGGGARASSLVWEVSGNDLSQDLSPSIVGTSGILEQVIEETEEG